MTLLIIFIAIALSISFICSIFEAVLLSITPMYVASKQASDKEYGQRLAELKGNVEKPLSAILTLNTIAHTVGATGAGAQALLVFGDAYMAAFSTVLTLAILIFSEIIPKSIGASYWQKLAPFTVKALPPIVTLLWPFVKLSHWITRFITPKDAQNKLKREDLNALNEMGHQQGIFDNEEFHMLSNFMKFGDLFVSAAMTPRTVAVSLIRTDSIEEVKKLILNKPPFSRIPLVDKDAHNVTSYVLRSEILKALVINENISEPVSTLERPAVIVNSKTNLRTLFKTLMDKQEHISIVVDDFGVYLGIITLEDLLETMLGLEIKDEGDTIEDLQKHAREKWRKRAEKAGITVVEE